GAVRVQVVVAEEGDRSEASVHSQAAEAGAGAEWTRHASAVVRPASTEAPERLDLLAARARCSEPIDVDTLYDASASLGLEYGPTFRGIRSLYCGKGEALAEVALPDGVEAGAYGVHPALLDAAFQAVMGLYETEGLSLPFAMERLTVYPSVA